MSHRTRALAFASAAALCAGLAASAAGGGGSSLEAQLGELRDVAVAIRPLAPGRRLDERAVSRSLAVRRVPERFLPPDALTDPAQALGRVPAAPIPAGGYVLGSQLRSSAPRRPARPRLRSGRRAVEIAVQGAGALARAAGRRVDVIVTTEPRSLGGGGRTYVAAERVALLELRPAPRSATEGAAGASQVATLALTRAQALELIEAEAFARSVRLIAGGG